ncbi:hypothetical protein F4801DRAFT_564222 [Xylaria longipes]|nr:hypothetical protein F4801DRAFT_564222 [Xylaria longipes]
MLISIFTLLAPVVKQALPGTKSGSAYGKTTVTLKLDISAAERDDGMRRHLQSCNNAGTNPYSTTLRAARE